MEILLRRDVEKIGSRGEVVRVKSGYARNYLIPRGLAVPATAEAKEEIERERVREQRRLEEERKRMEELAGKLEKSSCTISAPATEEGHLFGSVSAAEIVAAFAEDGIQLQPEQLVLESPIKEIGVYGFTIRLSQNLEVTSKVWVVKE
jgi:large subunit ribosomal protein L9